MVSVVRNPTSTNKKQYSGLGGSNSSKKSLSQLNQMKEKHSRRSWDTDCNQSHNPKSQTRPSIHQVCLQNSHCFTYDGVILGIIPFLPLHPIRRWLVVPLYHVHLMDPLPQCYHALIHQPPTEVLSHGSLDRR